MLERGDEGFVEPRREGAGLRMHLAVLERPSFGDPFRQAASEDTDVLDPISAQRPPDPRRSVEAQEIVDDEAHAVAESERGHLLGQHVRLRQHVRQGRAEIGDRVDVEIDGAGNMPEAEFDGAEAAGVRKMPGAVDQAEVGVAEFGGEFVGRAVVLRGHSPGP